MAWLKLDDTMPQHDKITDVTVEARWLYIAGLCWSSSLLTDGKIPRKKLRRIEPDVDTEAGLDELVRVGLWTLDERGDIEIVNYLAHQRSAADVKKTREFARTLGLVRAKQRAEQNRGARPASYPQASSAASPAAAS